MKKILSLDPNGVVSNDVFWGNVEKFSVNKFKLNTLSRNELVERGDIFGNMKSLQKKKGASSKSPFESLLNDFNNVRSESNSDETEKFSAQYGLFLYSSLEKIKSSKPFDARDYDDVNQTRTQPHLKSIFLKVVDGIKTLHAMNNPADPNAKETLKSVLGLILDHFQGQLGADHLGSVREGLLWGLRDIFTRFGDNSCDAIRDVMESRGKEKDMLVRLYVLSRMRQYDSEGVPEQFNKRQVQEDVRTKLSPKTKSLAQNLDAVTDLQIPIAHTEDTWKALKQTVPTSTPDKSSKKSKDQKISQPDSRAFYDAIVADSENCSGSMRGMFDAVKKLNRLTPINFQADDLLKQVLETVAFDVQGNKNAEGNVFSNFRSKASSHEPNPGLRFLLLTQALEPLFVKFGSKTLDVILRIMDEKGENGDLKALYLHVKAKSADNLVVRQQSTLAFISDELQGLDSGKHDSDILFQGLKTILDSVAWDTIQPLDDKPKIIDLISDMFLELFRDAFERKGLSSDQLRSVQYVQGGAVMLETNINSIQNVVEKKLKEANDVLIAAYEYKGYIARQKTKIKEALEQILSLESVDDRRALLTHFNEQFMALGPACCEAVKELIVGVGKNKGLLFSLYMASYLNGCNSKEAFDEKKAVLQKEKQEAERKEREAHLARLQEERKKYEVIPSSLSHSSSQPAPKKPKIELKNVESFQTEKNGFEHDLKQTLAGIYDQIHAQQSVPQGCCLPSKPKAVGGDVEQAKTMLITTVVSRLLSLSKKDLEVMAKRGNLTQTEREPQASISNVACVVGQETFLIPLFNQGARTILAGVRPEVAFVNSNIDEICGNQGVFQKAFTVAEALDIVGHPIQEGAQSMQVESDVQKHLFGSAGYEGQRYCESVSHTAGGFAQVVDFNKEIMFKYKAAVYDRYALNQKEHQEAVESQKKVNQLLVHYVIKELGFEATACNIELVKGILDQRFISGSESKG